MRRLAILALIVAGCCWGLGFPLGKLALREMDPSQLVLLRFAVAAVAAAPFALARRDTRALFRSPPVVIAGVFYAVAFLLQFEGLAGVSVALAALLVGAMPALIAVCARFMGERQTRLSWVGVAGATLGAAAIAGRPGGAGTPLGIALSLLSLLVFMGWLVALKRAPKAPTPMAIPAVTVIVAALTLLPVSLLLHGPPRLDFSLAAWAGVIGQGLLATLLATAAWQFGAAQVGATTAGVFINIEPVMGAVIGVFAFGDRLTPGLAFGGALVLIGSVAVVIGERNATLPLAHDAPATPA